MPGDITLPSLMDIVADSLENPGMEAIEGAANICSDP